MEEAEFEIGRAKNDESVIAELGERSLRAR